MKEINILSLGDSYSVGEGVSREDSFPFILARMVNSLGIRCNTIRVIARTGWTCGELLNAIDKGDVFSRHWDVITLLAGVNNQYRGLPIETFHMDFSSLMNKCVALSGDKPGKIVVISIPDYGVTPFVTQMDREEIAKDIVKYNNYVRETAHQYGCSFIDITDISRLAGKDDALLSDDRLHPSAIQYNMWSKQIFPSVKKIVTDE